MWGALCGRNCWQSAVSFGPQAQDQLFDGVCRRLEARPFRRSVSPSWIGPFIRRPDPKPSAMIEEKLQLDRELRREFPEGIVVSSTHGAPASRGGPAASNAGHSRPMPERSHLHQGIR